MFTPIGLERALVPLPREADKSAFETVYIDTASKRSVNSLTSDT